MISLFSCSVLKKAVQKYNKFLNLQTFQTKFYKFRIVLNNLLIFSIIKTWKTPYIGGAVKTPHYFRRIWYTIINGAKVRQDFVIANLFPILTKL